MTSGNNWQVLEERVRTIASHIWNCPALPELVNGVRCDAVLKIEPDHWILLEVSKTASLEKLRTDLAKFASVKPALMARGIYAKCIFVCEGQPTESLVATGQGQFVDVVSVDDFQKRFFDYGRYHFVRSNKRFGSAVDPESGEPDSIPYVRVFYEAATGKQYAVADICRIVTGGARVILLGNYGTGKSRCIQQMFFEYKAHVGSRAIYPLAIDLRDNWGLRRASEVLTRHFEELGLATLASAAMRLSDKGALCLFLDGFDEIASQVWSDDPSHLEAIRAESLSGIKELIQSVRGGVIATGREHYFNTDGEMFRCLGLSEEKTLVLRCAEEFSESEMSEYLRSVDVQLDIPHWLPRRPLVSKLLVSLEPEQLTRFLSEENGEIAFWYTFLDAVCSREARIRPSLTPESIRSVLLEIAQVARTKPGALGPISLVEINGAFEKVVGRPPRDEASAMLQRLPVLGRVDAGSSDRQFVDAYILEGLAATALVEALMQGAYSELLHTRWQRPLGAFGRALLAENISSPEIVSSCLRLLKQSEGMPNKVLPGDLVSAMLATQVGQVDFEHLRLRDTHLGAVNLADTDASNIHFEDCIIEELTIANSLPRGISIQRCIILKLQGLSQTEELPSWIVESTVESFAVLTNVARIREAGLSREQKILVTIVHKIFFQPGSGREADALLRGLGEVADNRAAKKILGLLLHEGIVTSFRGREGTVYAPIRKHARRMAKLMGLLKHSSDPIWLSVSGEE